MSKSSTAHAGEARAAIPNPNLKREVPQPHTTSDMLDPGTEKPADPEGRLCHSCLGLTDVPLQAEVSLAVKEFSRLQAGSAHLCSRGPFRGGHEQGLSWNQEERMLPSSSLLLAERTQAGGDSRAFCPTRRGSIQDSAEGLVFLFNFPTNVAQSTTIINREKAA